MSNLLTVFGATGQQGGALIDYVLKNEELSRVFKVRGVTRDVSKQVALTLKEKGVEMVQADLDVPTSLVKAVAGSHAVFGVTNYWEHISAPIETAQGKAIADACIAASVPQIIWSTLPNVTKMTNGEITAAKHFDSKAAAEEYIRTLDIKATFFSTGWFMQNHVAFMRPTPASDGTYVWSHIWNVDSRLPMIDIRDAGKFIAPALLNPDKYNGKTLTCATAFYTPLEIVDTWTQVTGKTIKLQAIDGESGNGFWSKEQLDILLKLKSMITKYSYFGPTGQADLKWTLDQLTEKPTSWQQFVQDHEPWFEDN